MHNLFKYSILIALIISFNFNKLTAFDRFLPEEIERKDSLRILQIKDSLNNPSDRFKAIELLNEYIEIAKKKNSKKLLADAYYQSSSLIENMSSSDQTLENFKRSLDIYKEINDVSGIVHSNVFIGVMYIARKKLDTALIYFQNAYYSSFQSDNYFDKASPAWSLLEIFTKMNSLDSAEYYGKIALDFVYKIPDSNKTQKIYAVSTVHTYLGFLYSKLDNKEKAIYHFKELINYSILNENKATNLANRYNRLLTYFNQIAFYDSTIYYSKEILFNIHSYTRSNFDEVFKHTYNLLIQAFEQKNQIDSAFKYQKIAMTITDTLKLSDNALLTARSEQKMSSMLHNKEIEYEKLKNQLFIWLGIISSLLFVLSLSLIYYRYSLKKKANIALEEINQTKNKFFSIISHDLKTPIAGFYSMSKVLSEYYEQLSDEEKIANIESLKNGSSHILHLLENLLTWSRIQSNSIQPTFEEFDINQTIDEEISNQLNFTFKKEIEIINNIKQELFVYADESMIATVIRNLISNSIKFTNPRGKIEIFANSNESYVTLIIKDNGIGFTDEIKENLFKLDKRTTSLGTQQEKGSGLGLNLCKEFIEKNKGKLEFESVVNQGTQFFITIPLFSE